MTAPIQEELASNTSLAAEKAVFGSPTYFYKNEPYFGQDRSGFLREAITGQPI
ncbi:hypothetical protein [Limibacillus halophilus]|uniref:2-hydroxychromene-2-carboxylate isomerase n=1 Tax=Limibacillus halophilus TaxID=1579333 RepID=A0A839SXD9_9PROT|nr:hypothetical protein [Limibacillus halophilus]MBB3066196.1 2-hydroxychromene-2-carboxylate isomerase [Limibacillus halophilus]